MPVKVAKRGDKWRIVEANSGKLARSGGTVVKAFSSRAAAQKAANARNAATEGKKRK